MKILQLGKTVLKKMLDPNLVTPGRLFVIEGPSGSGKSEFSKAFTSKLKSCGKSVLLAKEPRSSEDELCGTALLDRILIDRRKYLYQTIIPALIAGRTVVMDRYIPSMVYQMLDGIKIEELWEVNKNFLRPKMTIFLEAPREILDTRIARRNILTRFEKPEYRDQEILCYKKVSNFLATKGWSIATLNTSIDSTENLVNTVLDIINVYSV